jgi:phospholipase C
MIVISPFAKKNYVSHAVYDYTAILTLIEKRFGVAALTKRDAAQADMSADFFDFVNVPWATPPTPPAQVMTGQCTLTPPTP